MSKTGVYERIIHSASKVFAEKGYHGSNLREIAQDAGINKAMLFYYFKNKENLYFSILSLAFQEILERSKKIYVNQKSSFEKIKEMIASFTQIYIKNKDFFLIAMKEFESVKIMPLMKNSNYIYQINNIFVAIIQEGIKNREFRELDPRMTAVSIIGMIKLLITQENITGTSYNNEDICSFINEIIFRGILFENK